MALGNLNFVHQSLGQICQQRQLGGTAVARIMSQHPSGHQIHTITLGIHIGSCIVQQDRVTVKRGIKVVKLVSNKADRHHGTVRLRHKHRATMSGICGHMKADKDC